MNQQQTKMKTIARAVPINPCGPHVLVKPDPVEKKTASGIITGTADLHAREEVARVKGTLVAIGQGAWIDYADGEPWAQVGDHVYFKRHVSDRYEDEDDIVDGKPQQYFLLSDLDILGVINER